MRRLLGSVAIIAMMATQGFAQDSTAEAEPVAEEAAADMAADMAAETDLLTQAELETLVAPVALYPDTLLIQILVAATQPLEVVKADRFLLTNADADPETLKPQIEAENWDASVEVLAVGFPDVIADMAEHIEWTETMGDAMSAQTDDVMTAVQTMRNQAINSGALISGDEQTVEVDSNENVIIQPTNPEVVYVPQYDSTAVYNTSGTDLLTAGLIGFGTFLVIDAIFDDDDDWNGYWGCRDCGGWGGGPIYRNPDIDIDVDGNVNIGNSVGNGIGNGIGNGDGDGLRPGQRPDGGWAPDPDRQNEARDKIADKRGSGGATTLPIDKGTTNSDALRGKLAERSGAADISRPAAGLPGAGASNRLPQVDRPSERPQAVKRDAIARTKPADIQRPAAASRPAAANRPATVNRPASVQRPSAKPATTRKPSAIAKQSSGPRAGAASHRGGGKTSHSRARR